MTGTLILSVGGSPQPLRSAIEAGRWSRVVFVVSDGAKGTRSSRGQVEDAEIDYGTRDRPARGPGLRHLPACPPDSAIVAVPPDDLDRALALIDAALAAEIGRGAAVTIDYTGGTKTMTAAMVLAGTAHEGVRLQFMAGERRGLETVAAGTEAPVAMPGHLLGVANLFALARAQVGRRAYRAALDAVAGIERGLMTAQKAGLPRAPESWRRRAEGWRGWLAVLEAWDRFDIPWAAEKLAQALDVGQPWAKALDRGGYADRLRELADERTDGPGPATCEDLWLNAERRAALGLYDDAIARLYRLAEAAVQARLNRRHGIPDTGRVPADRVPQAIAARCDIRRDSRTGAAFLTLPLVRALDLLANLDPADPLVAVWPREGGRFAAPDWQAARNRSILAHGFRPASAADWQCARGWFDKRRGPLWEALLGRPTAPQLPDALP